MSVLSGNNGPRYKHSPDESAPYDTITVDKLTPIITSTSVAASGSCISIPPRHTRPAIPN